MAAPVEVVRLAECTPAAALADLRARGIRALLSEGGPTLFRGFLAAGLVDELFLTLSPLITGDEAETGDRHRRAAPGARARSTLRWVLRAERRTVPALRNRPLASKSMVRRLAVLMVLVLAAPSAAQAAEVSVTGGVLRYKAAPGKDQRRHVHGDRAAGPCVVERDTGRGRRRAHAVGRAASSTTVGVCIGVHQRRRSSAATARPRHRDLRRPARRPPGCNDPGRDRRRRRQRRDRRRHRATTRSTAAPATTTSTARPATTRCAAATATTRSRPNVGTDAISGGDGIDTVAYGLRATPTLHARRPGQRRRRGRERPDRRRRREHHRGRLRRDRDDRRRRAREPADGDRRPRRHHRRRRRRRPRGRPARRHDPRPRRLARHGHLQRRHRHRRGRHARHRLDHVRERLDPGRPGRRRSTTARRRSPGSPPAPTPACRANAATKLAVNATDDRGVAQGPVLRRRPAAVRGHAAPFACAYLPRGGGRRPQHADRGRRRRRRPDDERRSAPVTVRRFTPAGSALALAPEPRPQRRRTRSARRRLTRPTRCASQGCRARHGHRQGAASGPVSRGGRRSRASAAYR